jgi:hypothetical protein
LTNGDILAVEMGSGGVGSQAEFLATGDSLRFYEQVELSQYNACYTNTQYFQSTATSTVTIGDNEVTITNYTANSPKQVVTAWGGKTTFDTAQFSMSVPSGMTSSLDISLQLAGSTSVGGNVSGFDLAIRVLAFTVA